MKLLVPKVPLMKMEMKRRAEKLGFTKFRKLSVLEPEALTWLKNNPVSDRVDIEFLKRTEAERAVQDTCGCRERGRRSWEGEAGEF
jgi:hypothetical protein